MCAGDGLGDGGQAAINLPVVFVAAVCQHLNPVFLAVEFPHQSRAGHSHRFEWRFALDLGELLAVVDQPFSGGLRQGAKGYRYGSRFGRCAADVLGLRHQTPWARA